MHAWGEEPCGEKLRYQRSNRIPKVPSKEAIDKIIARATWKKATIFSVLRDTGMAPAELHKTRLRDIDLDRGLIQAVGLKGHKPRVLKLKPSTLAMLKKYLAKHSGEYPFPTRKAMADGWRRARDKVAEKLQDPTLKTIRLYDLRHYFGTMLYHKTKDIVYVKRALGHRNIQNTLIYTHLINFSREEFTVKVASNIEEATALVEQGFQYVTEMDDKKIFKRPKL